MTSIEDILGRWCLVVFKNGLWDTKAHLVKIISMSLSKERIQYQFPDSSPEWKSIHNIEILRIIGWAE